MDVDLAGAEVEVEVRIYKLIEQLAEKFGKDEQELIDFLVDKENNSESLAESYRKTIDKEYMIVEGESYNSVWVENDEIKELQKDIEYFEQRCYNIKEYYEDMFQPLENWWYIEGGRNMLESSDPTMVKIAKIIKELV